MILSHVMFYLYVSKRDSCFCSNFVNSLFLNSNLAVFRIRLPSFQLFAKLINFHFNSIIILEIFI